MHSVGAAGELGKGQRQRFDAPFNVPRGRELVGTVAPAVAAGDEDHAGGGETRHEKGVVVCSADQSLVARSQLLCRLCGCIDNLQHPPRSMCQCMSDFNNVTLFPLTEDSFKPGAERACRSHSSLGLHRSSTCLCMLHCNARDTVIL